MGKAVAPVKPRYATPQPRGEAAVALLLLCVVSFSLLAVAFTIDLLVPRPVHGTDPLPAVLLILKLSPIALVPGLAGAAVAVPMWAHRACRNLPALGAGEVRWSPAWAAGAWFIPVVNLVVPYLVVWKLWTQSGGRPQPPPPLLWWLAGLGGLTLITGDSIAFHFFRFERQVGDLLDIVGFLSVGTAGVLLSVLVHQISTRQRASFGI